MSDETKPAIKIRRIAIRNYKGIDHLDLEFPEPRMSGDPDVIVLGSENGVGKTSVLESCALLLHAVSLNVKQIEVFDRHNRVDIPDLLIRSGAGSAQIQGELELSGGDFTRAELEIDRVGKATILHDLPSISRGKISLEKRAEAEDIMKSILGMSTDPALGHDFMMFHSFRKVQEGNVNLDALVGRKRSTGALSYLDPSEPSVSLFKYLMLLTVLGDAGVLEHRDAIDVDPVLVSEKLNGLFTRFAYGTLGKLRPQIGGRFDFLFEPGSGGGESFSYDGLSSGQKEIIATVALVWFHTRNRQSVVLIDEPELHLNAQWHRSFVNKLFSLAPKNQYILATHSEDIMDSVERENRILLRDDSGSQVT